MSFPGDKRIEYKGKYYETKEIREIVRQLENELVYLKNELNFRLEGTQSWKYEEIETKK